MNRKFHSTIAFTLCAALLIPSGSSAAGFARSPAAVSAGLSRELFTTQTLSAAAAEFNAVVARSVFLQARKRDARAVRRSYGEHPILWNGGLAAVLLGVLAAAHPWTALMGLGAAVFQMASSVSFSPSERMVLFMRHAGQKGWPPLTELFADARLSVRINFETLHWFIDNDANDLKNVKDIRAALQSTGLSERNLNAAMDALSYNVPALSIPAKAARQLQKQALPATLPSLDRNPAPPPTRAAEALPKVVRVQPPIEVEDPTTRLVRSLTDSYGTLELGSVHEFFLAATVLDLALTGISFPEEPSHAQLVAILDDRRAAWMSGLDVIERLEDVFDFAPGRIRKILRIAKMRRAIVAILGDPHIKLQTSAAAEHDTFHVQLNDARSPYIYALDWRYSPDTRTLDIVGLTFAPRGHAEDYLNTLLAIVLLLHHRQNVNAPAEHLQLLSTVEHAGARAWFQHIAASGLIDDHGALNWSLIPLARASDLLIPAGLEIKMRVAPTLLDANQLSQDGVVAAWGKSAHIAEGTPALEAPEKTAAEFNVSVEHAGRAMTVLNLLSESEFRNAPEPAPVAPSVVAAPLARTLPTRAEILRNLEVQRRRKLERRLNRRRPQATAPVAVPAPAPPAPPPVVAVVAAPTLPPTRVERWVSHVLIYIASAGSLYQFLRAYLRPDSKDLADALVVLRSPRLGEKLRSFGLIFSDEEPLTLDAVLDAFRAAHVNIKVKRSPPVEISIVASPIEMPAVVPAAPLENPIRTSDSFGRRILSSVRVLLGLLMRPLHARDTLRYAFDMRAQS